MEEGYPMVNIKTIAAKVGCSTQPISWQFGNMQGMRKELFKYASEQIFGDIEQKIANMNAMEAFFETGQIYISNACEYPNVFRFLCVDDPGDIVEKSSSVADLLGDDFIKEMLAKEIELPTGIFLSIHHRCRLWIQIYSIRNILKRILKNIMYRICLKMYADSI